MTQIYSKSSFDRFGDDLCELIVSYLSFTDRIRMECVSYQFSNSVYRRQTVLLIDEWLFKKFKTTDIFGVIKFDIKQFKVFISKLTMLKTITIQYNTFWCEFPKFLLILELTIKYCQQMTDIEIEFQNISDDKLNKLFKKFGNKITKIKFDMKDPSAFDQFFSITNISNCTSLKEIKLEDIRYVFHGKNNCLVHNLEKLSIFYRNDDSDMLINLIDINKDSLKSVDVCLSRYIQAIPLSMLMKEISKLKKLEELKISFLEYYPFTIIPYLEEISENCPKLETIYLYFTSDTIDTNIEIMESMKNFKSLKKLELLLKNNIKSDNITHYLSKYLKECQSLTHLTLRLFVDFVSNEFFEDIDKYLPNIQYLNLWVWKLGEPPFVSLSKLKNLRSLQLWSPLQTPIEEDFVYDLIDSCPKLNFIELKNFETLDYKETEENAQIEQDINDISSE